MCRGNGRSGRGVTSVARPRTSEASADPVRGACLGVSTSSPRGPANIARGWRRQEREKPDRHPQTRITTVDSSSRMLREAHPPGPWLGNVDAYHPVDAKSVQEIPRLASPGLLGELRLRLTAFGEGLEDLGDALPVRPIQSNGEAFADLGRVFGVAIRTDDPRAVSIKSRVRDAVPRSGRPDLALLVHRLEHQVAAQHSVIKLHGLARAALKVDVRAQKNVAHAIDLDLLVRSGSG